MLVCGVSKVGYLQSICYKSVPIQRADKSNTSKINADVVSFTGKNVLPLTIRNARLTDIPAILQLDRLCFPEYVIRRCPNQEALKRTINKDASLLTVAIDRTNGRTVGYFYVHSDNTGKLSICVDGIARRLPDNPIEALAHIRKRQSEKGLWLDSMAVHPEVQGQKVGQQLMLALFKKAAQKNVGAIALGVETGNDAAQKLYRKFGFFNLQKLRDYYIEGKDIYLMGVDTNAPGTAGKLEALRKEVGLGNAE